MKKTIAAVLILSIMVVTVVGCGKKNTEETEGKTGEITGEEKTGTDEEVSDRGELEFLKLLGLDCQQLPSDVTVENTESRFTVTFTKADLIGGVKGYVNMGYPGDSGIIDTISWNATSVEMEQIDAVKDVLAGLYGSADLDQITDLEDGDGSTEVLTWNHAEDMKITASMEENPVTGSSILLTWVPFGEDDNSFLQYLGQSKDQIAEATADMTEDGDGMLIGMSVTNLYGVQGSVTYYYDTATGVVKKIQWDSYELSMEQMKELEETAAQENLNLQTMAMEGVAFATIIWE